LLAELEPVDRAGVRLTGLALSLHREPDTRTNKNYPATES
jgi:hypothetical protein